ncbi:hypothetical protein PV328_011252 [Microctonus aethiopoides]|uniref:Peptidase S1 domain-containing protein n=1 Tax=Microctonus aethiopoides TaxID=144406 RepID=A0AA39F046_9HYME|nr:hypothetical protein PV328_011252 [Microctonus aethiopoides]
MKLIKLFLLLFFITIIFLNGLTAFYINKRFKRQYDLSYGSPSYKYCECGRKNLLVGDIRIVGGVEAAETEYPWMSLITGNGTKLAGGSLINDRYVITAAHILDRKFTTSEMKVVLGEYNVCEFDSQTIVFSIEKLIIHPKYDSNTLFADIMLIKLNMRVTFNEFIRPICLPMTDVKIKTAMKYGGKNSIVLGWGFADIGEDVCILRMVNLEIFKSEYCDSNIKTIICAGVKDGRASDACATVEDLYKY